MAAEERIALDLEAYRERIGFSGEFAPTRDSIAALHLAHTTHIPFENLDILLGRPIRIDLDSIQAKLVHGRRGGYCFEHNRLFAAVLERLGLPVTYLAARVRYRVSRLLPRTHVLLLVEIEGRPWVADVGFGTVGLLEPIPLCPNQPVSQFGWSYRLVQEAGTWLLQTLQQAEWQNLYSFTLEPQFLPDLEVANHYVATHPHSRFVQALIAQRSTTAARFMLRNLDLIVDRGNEAITKSLHNQFELMDVLAEIFDLRFPTETRFHIPSLDP